EKAAVDFLGHVLLPSGPLPLVFDAKEVSRGDRWPLSKLEQHQYEYLRDCALTGAFSFVLIGFWELERFFVLPFSELERRWTAWKNKTGPASVRAGEPGLVEVRFPGYLSFLEVREDVKKHG
ncbi:MAG: Holliday junction resolvase RecU, partial [Desulfofundulus sp.]